MGVTGIKTGGNTELKIQFLIILFKNFHTSVVGQEVKFYEDCDKEE